MVPDRLVWVLKLSEYSRWVRAAECVGCHWEYNLRWLTKTGQQNIAWSDELWCLMWHLVRNNLNAQPSFSHNLDWWWCSNSVGDIFLTCTKWASCKHHSLLKYCCWLCLSLHDHSVLSSMCTSSRLTHLVTKLKWSQTGLLNTEFTMCDWNVPQWLPQSADGKRSGLSPQSSDHTYCIQFGPWEHGKAVKLKFRH